MWQNNNHATMLEIRYAIASKNLRMKKCLGYRIHNMLSLCFISIEKFNDNICKLSVNQIYM